MDMTCRILYGCAGMAVGGLLTLLAVSRQPIPTPAVVTMAAPARVLKTVERVTVPCQQVQAYKPAAKRAIKLPATVAANPAAHVIAASDLPASRTDTRVSTVLDTDSGHVDSYTQALPSPWLRPEINGSLGAYYGLKTASPKPVGRLQGDLDLLQIKQAHVGGIASIDTDGEGFVGIGIRGGW